MKPRLFEALMQRDGEFKEHMETLRHKANVHPFLKRYCEVGVKEGLFSDSVSALGRLHDTLVQAAYPEMIGRNIITVRPTTEAMERFPLDEKAVAYRYAEGVAARLSGKKNSTVDVYTNVLSEASEEWTREFLEDATWNVMDSMVEKVGRALGEEETNTIVALYGAVADAYIGPESEATLKTVTDALALSDASYRNKSLVIADTSGLADAVLQNKTLAATDSVDVNDAVLTDKAVVIADAVNLAGSIIVDKVLQVTETINLVETVQVGVGSVKKTKLFLIIGDLAVQLTGE
jgi:hypothetical protein